jgi:hypothetical protein|tara:strand:- start:101 stop:418 length:318 start_codon:yes stop_codon:yes gene_type:complete
MKKMRAILLGLIVLSQLSYGNSADMKEAYQSDVEPSVLDALWAQNGRFFQVARWDKGQQQNGFAQYVCQDMSYYGVNSSGKLVQVISMQSIQEGSWKVIGQSKCN